MVELDGFDAYAPPQIAERVARVGVAKARLPLLPTLMLGLLAGAFIGLGALGFVIVQADPGLGPAPRLFLGGLVFSLGLLLVLVAGAELFTGNNLLAMAWADGLISSRELLRNWLLVGLANAAGALGLALLVLASGHLQMQGGAIGATVIQIALAKTGLPWWEALVRGLLCNVLVCLAVWMALAGRSVADKAVAVVFPVSVFVAAGFEHSIANLYLLPLALLMKAAGQGGPAAEGLSVAGVAAQLLPVTLGNLLGGSVMVAGVYHLIYRRGRPPAPAAGP